MSATRTQTHAVARFSCLGDACPDTCCKGWGMQLTRDTIQLFEDKAPELLDAVDSGEAEFIMKRDPATDYCVKFDVGWCGIHRDYGPEFLGDACHFYPRVTRALNDTVVTSMALSCPEAARMLLYDHHVLDLTPREELRIPFSLKNYLPPELSAAQALAIHQKFVEEAANASCTPERNVLRLTEVARALEMQQPDQWEAATHFYFTIAEGRLPKPEPDANDLVHVVQALMGLILASKSSNRAGLMAIAQQMMDTLGITLNETTRDMTVAPDGFARGIKLLHSGAKHADALRPVLTRYLQAQLSQALFPFAGLGQSLSERMTVIAIRFATLRLALMCHAQAGEGITPEAIVQITYTLSRFLDHLADATLSMAIYHETGWVRSSRLRALLGDA